MRRAIVNIPADFLVDRLALPAGTHVTSAWYVPGQEVVQFEVVHDDLAEVPEGVTSPMCFPSWTHRNAVPLDRRVYCPEPIFLGWGQS